MSDLKPCPACQREVSPRALSCPHCGEPLARPPRKPGLQGLRPGLKIIGVAGCIAFMGFVDALAGDPVHAAFASGLFGIAGLLFVAGVIALAFDR